MLAMTSIAVTASICANASEVALLVASFMPVFSLNLGVTHRGAKTRNDRQNFYSEHPATSLRPVLVVPTRRISTVPVSNGIEAAI
jgi:hypothetical protein